jgi:hypothetical protein
VALGRGRMREDPADGAFSDPMTEPKQFTPDPPVPPSWVLSGHPDHQVTQLIRGHDPMEVKPCGKQSRQSGRQRPVGPVRLWPGDLTSQDGDLMTQHQDLHVLGGVAPREKRQPAEQPDHQQIQQA